MTSGATAGQVAQLQDKWRNCKYKWRNCKYKWRNCKDKWRNCMISGATTLQIGGLEKDKLHDCINDITARRKKEVIVTSKYFSHGKKNRYII